ncbi:glycosyl hydrolase family 18 protein [Paenibacillus sp. JCM 10914]|uniref:glycosyl hydrolase family 18 protein n=1 Tax=Paenibacillus sp. JCM 10914 TaxID=1236974 RepID=UPI0003CC9F71|nr:glycosyl hydrolase family 18 protein [Paenibacillus sp. JCM 10914]GAE07991.1 chitinase [Paenibacillus sp. JCM 10914]
MSHINYSFALISNGRATITNNDRTKLQTMVGLKSRNPDLKVLLSVGGWGANGFSDAALTDASRTIFADSLVQLVTANNLDGVDLDWEYPTNPAGGTTARPQDKQNFTHLLAKVREKLNAQGQINGKQYLLTIAAGANSGYINGVELNNITPLLDWINIMTYDFHGSWDSTTGHHSNLSGRDISVTSAVNLFRNGGVPASKLVIGGAFYGRGWTGVQNGNNGLDRPASGGFETDYNTIVAQYLNKNGYTRYWDSSAQAPYLFNGNTFITYDDPQSLSLKAQYVKNNNLGGIMFWEYSNDRSGALLQSIYTEITSGGGGQPPIPSGYSYLVAQANQQIVSADNYGNDPLVANRTTAGDWELFELITNSDGTVSLKSKVNGKYVTADLNASGVLVARATSIQQWEKFNRVNLSDGTIALQALANNLYVTCEVNNGGRLIANRTAVGGAWEAFRVQNN